MAPPSGRGEQKTGLSEKSGLRGRTTWVWCTAERVEAALFRLPTLLAVMQR